MIKNNTSHLRTITCLVIAVTLLNQSVSAQTTESAMIAIPSSTPAEVGMSADKLNQIDVSMEKSIADNLIAGGIVMIARDGKVVFERAYGLMDREANKPMKTDTIVRIFSMTKAITTAAALMLCEDGKLDVNDPVSKYLPELRDVKVAWGDELKPATRVMTIADLMRHTSGYSYGDSGNKLHDAKSRMVDFFGKGKTLEQSQALLAEIPLPFEPATDWLYGVSTDVLGRVVEVVSGQSLDQFFSQRIFDPLGMNDTGFFVPADKVDRFAANYNSDGKGNLTLGDSPTISTYLATPTMLSGGGGLVSTASDYMRFLLMISAGGEFGGKRLMKPETVSLMTTNQIPKEAGWVTFGDQVRTGVGFGFGFSVRKEMSDWDPDGRIGEYGWGGAASTHYWVSPKDNNLIVITIEQIMPYQWLTEFKLKGIIYDAIED